MVMKIPVECYKCKKLFDFSDFLKEEDLDKPIEEVRKKYCGDKLLCRDCVMVWKDMGSEVLERLKRIHNGIKTMKEKTKSLEKENASLLKRIKELEK